MAGGVALSIVINASQLDLRDRLAVLGFQLDGDGDARFVYEAGVEQLEIDTHRLFSGESARRDLQTDRAIRGGQALAPEHANQLHPEPLGVQLSPAIPPAPDLVRRDVNALTCAVAQVHHQRQWRALEQACRRREHFSRRLESPRLDTLRIVEPRPPKGRIDQIARPTLRGFGRQAQHTEAVGQGRRHHVHRHTDRRQRQRSAHGQQIRQHRPRIGARCVAWTADPEETGAALRDVIPHHLQLIGGEERPRHVPDHDQVELRKLLR